MAKGNGIPLTAEQKTTIAAKLAETSARRVALRAELDSLAKDEEKIATMLGTALGNVKIKDPEQGETMAVRLRKGTGKDGIAAVFFFSRPWEKPAKDSEDDSVLDLLAV